jgi:hypothetical protein
MSASIGTQIAFLPVILNTGPYTIRPILSTGWFVDAHENSEQDFSLVIRTEQHNNTQRWILIPVGGVYNIWQFSTIQQLSPGRFMDAYENSDQDFRLVTRPEQTNDTQKWILTHVGNSTFTIQQ